MRKKIAGFTLLEVMIAIAILGVIMTLIWSTTGQTLRAKDRTEDRDLVFQMGRVALRKMSDDIAIAFLVKRAQATPEITPEATMTTAATVPQISIKTFFIGEDQGGQDSLKFTSFSHLRLFKAAKESDQCRISYEIVSDPEDPNGLNLIRREDPWLDDTTEVKGRQLVLVKNIREFNLEYYDTRKREWVKNWDSEKVDWRSRLPSAVKISIVFPDPDDEERDIPLSTAVLIALSDEPIEF